MLPPVLWTCAFDLTLWTVPYLLYTVFVKFVFRPGLTIYELCEVVFAPRNRAYIWSKICKYMYPMEGKPPEISSMDIETYFQS